jgi:hypothetical protein
MKAARRKKLIGYGEGVGTAYKNGRRWVVSVAKLWEEGDNVSREWVKE